MLRLPPFEYLSPRTLHEAVDLLAQHGPEAMLVAGGTDLYPGMKRRLYTPKKLVGLRQIDALHTMAVVSPENTNGPIAPGASSNGHGLNGHHVEDGGGLRLGAGITLATVATDPVIGQQYGSLATAASAISTPQLRTAGTIGGNLCVDTRCTYYNQSEGWREALGYCMKLKGDTCWVAPGSPNCLAVQSSDAAPVLIALDASVRLVGPTGERWIPVAELYQNDGMKFLRKQPDEILAEIHIPDATGTGQAYKKLRRRGSFDFPILSVAVALRMAEDGTCTAAQIVLGAVGSAPIVAVEATDLLVGERLHTGGGNAREMNDEVIEEAAQLAYKRARPLDNTDMTLSYRKQMTRVYVARALKDAIANRYSPQHA